MTRKGYSGTRAVVKDAEIRVIDLVCYAVTSGVRVRGKPEGIMSVKVTKYDGVRFREKG